MKREQIKDSVVDIIAFHLSIDKSTIAESSIITDDLGADSLDEIELLMMIEEGFDLDIDDTQGESVKTVGEVVDGLVKLLS